MNTQRKWKNEFEEGKDSIRFYLLLYSVLMREEHLRKLCLLLDCATLAQPSVWLKPALPPKPPSPNRNHFIIHNPIGIMMDIYAHRRDPEYGFPTPGAKVEFAADSACTFLEISNCGLSDERKWIEKEGEIQDENLRDWVTSTTHSCGTTGDSADTRETAPGGLKILFGVCGYDHEKCCPVLPFRKDAFEFLQQRFGIPEQFLSILIGTTARAFKYSPSVVGDQNAFCPSISYIFRFGVWRPSYYQIAISYDLKTKSTFAIILAKRPEHQFSSLIQSFKQAWKSCSHPLLIACLVIQIALNTNAERIQVADVKLNSLEETTGQHEYINRPLGNPLEMDFVTVTRTLNFLARIMGVEKMRLSSTLLALNFISRECTNSQSLQPPPLAAGEENAACERISEMSADHMNACRNLILRAEYQEKRVHTQVSVVYQFMAAKDSKVNISLAETTAVIAQESKKDSSSMKAIAVLTMFFLPGTFLAAVFAMPFFNWDDGTIVARNGFRIYWAIAIPLTLVVLVLWAISMALPWNSWLERFTWQRRIRGLQGTELGLIKTE